MTKPKKIQELCLTNASKRFSITLGVVMVKVHYRGVDYDCDTADEAFELGQRISQDREELAEYKQGITHALYGTKRRHVWKAKYFEKFIESLGEPQQCILKFLVRESVVRDEELRKLMGIESNQQLAGILSGISKQAAALNVPARSVFTINNESNSGNIEKWYLIAEEFMDIAKQMNWPEE